MDVSPIVRIFDSLLSAGAAVALVATAFFVMLAGLGWHPDPPHKKKAAAPHAPVVAAQASGTPSQ